ERRREHHEVASARVLEQLGVPLPRGMRLAIQIPERASVPRTARDRELTFAGVERHRARAERLELHRVATRVRGGVDERVCARPLTEVVRGHLGDHERLAVRTDGPADVQARRHWTTNSWKNMRRTLC